MNRTAIWVETIAMTAVYALAIWMTDLYFVSFHVAARALRVALAFATVQIVVILAMTCGLFIRKAVVTRRARRSAQMHGLIQQSLALEAAGQDQLRNLRSLMRRSRRDMEEGVTGFLATIRGNASDRIVAVARALDIETPGAHDRLERLFSKAASGNLLVRAATTEELERYANELAPAQITKALTSSDLLRTRAALDMIVAWKRVLPVRNVEPLIHHPDPEIRASALRALPWVEATNAVHAVATGLSDRDPSARIAAAGTAARMRITAAVPQLAEILARDDREVALAAAFALAVLSGGIEVLERTLASANRAAGSVAFEALEKAALGRV